MSEAFDVLATTPPTTARGAVVRTVGAAANGATDVNTKSTTVAHTQVASNAASATQLAANTGRVRASFFNNPNGGAGSVCSLRLDATAATLTNGVILIASGGYFEMPVDYTGAVTAIWTVANAAQLQIGEYS